METNFDQQIQDQQDRIECLSDLYNLKKQAIQKHDRVADYINGGFGDAFPRLRMKWEYELDIMQRAIGRINDRINRQLTQILNNQ